MADQTDTSRAALKSMDDDTGHVICERCQGNGEIVTDWDRYRHPLPEDAGDEAVAQCPDCSGTGYADRVDEG